MAALERSFSRAELLRTRAVVALADAAAPAVAGAADSRGKTSTAARVAREVDVADEEDDECEGAVMVNPGLAIMPALLDRAV